jgi:hypothetical protein
MISRYRFTGDIRSRRNGNGFDLRKGPSDTQVTPKFLE